jgi:choline-sulfatase
VNRLRRRARRIPKTLPAISAVLLGFLASAALANGNPQQTPVLLITIDTLRADHLGCYGARSVRTPAIDALAAQGVRFERAMAQVPITLPSHTAILTGTYPMYNGEHDFTSPTLPENVGVVAQAFERQGYVTAAFVSAFVLNSSWGLNRGFRTYDDHFGPQQFEMRNPANIERRADETVGRLLRWFETWAAGAVTRPFFVWLHLYDPHSPYDPPQPFHTQYGSHLYDGEIAYTDSQLARLFAALRRSGVYDRALIVLVSDHGESLGEHGEPEHSFFIYDATLHVPLIFKPPLGMASPRVVRRLAGSIDIAPTLLDLLHIRDPLSRQFQGVSLASDILGKGSAREHAVYSESYYPRDSFGWSELRCISTERFKYIQAPRPELYDARKDPRELHNVYGQRASIAAEMRAQLESVERRYASPLDEKASGPPLLPETVEKLKSLGYLVYSAPVQHGTNGSLPDPKDRVKVYRDMLQAYMLSSAGRTEESDVLLKTLAVEDPHLHLVPFLQAENFERLHRWREAEQSYLACLKLNPTFEQAIMGLAHLYLLDEGNVAQAKPWLELAVHRNPHNFIAYYALGLAARRGKNNEEAYRYFLKSAEEKPDYAFSQRELGVTLVDLQRYHEAVEPLQRAEKLGLQDPRLEHYLGTALANVGRYTEAVDSYQRALKLDPELAEARLSLAFAYLNLGDRNDARREFGALCQQSPPMCQQYGSTFK